MVCWVARLLGDDDICSSGLLVYIKSDVTVFLPNRDVQNVYLIVLFFFDSEAQGVSGCIETIKDIGNISLIVVV